MLPGAGVRILAGQPVTEWGEVKLHDNLLLKGDYHKAFRQRKSPLFLIFNSSCIGVNVNFKNQLITYNIYTPIIVITSEARRRS